MPRRRWTRLPTRPACLPGLLYHHFDSKAAVLNAIFEQSLTDVQATFAAADREARRARIDCRRCCGSALAIVPRHRQFWAVWYGLRMQQDVLEEPRAVGRLNSRTRSCARSSATSTDIELARCADRSAIAVRADRRPVPALRARSRALSARARDRAARRALFRRAEPCESRYVTARCITWTKGSGPPILFVHGTPTNSYEYRHLIAALSKRFRCIAPDHLGFGQSSRPQIVRLHARSARRRAEGIRGAPRSQDYTLVVHDFGGPIGLPLAHGARAWAGLAVQARVEWSSLNTWAWPLDDDPKMARGARFIGGAIGRFLYRYANASLRLIMPSAYGDRKKLTQEIHRRYLDVFRDRDARVLVLHALAKSLLGSRAHYQSLLDRIERLRADAGPDRLGHEGQRVPAVSARALARAVAGSAGRNDRGRRTLAARRGAGARRRRNRGLPEIRSVRSWGLGS